MKLSFRYILVLISAVLIGGVSGYEWDISKYHIFDAEELEIHGFFSQGYLQSSRHNYIRNAKQGTFDFREYGINFSTDLTEDIRVGTQLLWRKYGDLGKDKVMVDWAVLDWHLEDWLGFRLGRCKVPYGLYNETRDIDAVRTSILLPTLYSEGLRENYQSITGVGVYGRIPLEEAGAFSYQVLYGQQRLTDDGGVSKTFESNPFYENKHFETKPAYVLSGTWETPIEGLRLRGTYFNGRIIAKGKSKGLGGVGFPDGTYYELDFHDYDDSIVSAEYTTGNFVFYGEMQKLRAHTKNNLQSQAAVPFKSMFAETSQESVSWHYGGVYQFNDKLSGEVRYSTYYFDNNDRDGKGVNPHHRYHEHDLTFSMRYDVSDSWILKAEVHFIEGTAVFPSRVNPDWSRHNSSVVFALKSTWFF